MIAFSSSQHALHQTTRKIWIYGQQNLKTNIYIYIYLYIFIIYIHCPYIQWLLESIQTPLNFSLFVILQPFAKII